MEIVPRELSGDYGKIIETILEEFTELPDEGLQKRAATYQDPMNSVWTALSSPIDYLPKPIENNDTLPFPSRNIDEAREAYQQLQGFHQEFKGLIYLNNESGLPSYLYSNFRQQFAGDPYSTSVQFLDKYELMLGGRRSGLRLRSDWLITWNKVRQKSQHVRFQQVNPQDIPVWGSHITFTYDSENALSLITSSLYPVSADELPDFPDEQPPLERLVEILKSGVPSAIGWSDLAIQTEIWPQRCIYPFRQVKIFSQRLWQFRKERWGMYKSKKRQTGNRQGIYRAVWIVPFFDRYQRYWKAFIDAKEETILHLSLAEVYAYKSYVVLPRNNDVEFIQSALHDNDVERLDQLIWERNLKLSVELGDGITKFIKSPFVRFIRTPNDRVLDPEQLPPGNETSAERFLAANVFYHCRKMQSELSNLMTLTEQNHLPNPQPHTPTNTLYENPVNSIQILLENSSGEPFCETINGVLHFTKGTNTGYKIQEPGFDGEVITHELIHAYLHYFCYHLFQFSNSEVNEEIGHGFDEGLAFYFACMLVDNQIWGEYAYKNWQQWRDIDQSATSYDELINTVTTDPAGLPYRIGMWWAKVLWKLLKGIDDSFNLVLLSTLFGLSSILPITEASGQPDLEQVRSAFKRIGAVLFAQANRASDQEIIRNVLQNAGIPLV